MIQILHFVNPNLFFYKLRDDGKFNLFYFFKESFSEFQPGTPYYLNHELLTKKLQLTNASKLSCETSTPINSLYVLVVKTLNSTGMSNLLVTATNVFRNGSVSGIEQAARLV